MLLIKTCKCVCCGVLPFGVQAIEIHNLAKKCKTEVWCLLCRGVGCIFTEMVSGVATFPGMKDAMDQLDRIWRVSIYVISCIKYIAIVLHEKLHFTSSQLSWINFPLSELLSLGYSGLNL